MIKNNPDLDASSRSFLPFTMLLHFSFEKSCANFLSATTRKCNKILAVNLQYA